MGFVEDLEGHKFKSLEAIIPALRRLRDLADKAEYDFIRACMAVEDSPLWTGCESARDVSFGHWLARCSVCGADRYDRGAKGLRTPKIAKVATVIGMPAVRCAVECPTEHLPKLLESYVAYSNDHGAAVLPEERARQIRDNLVGGKVRESQTANTHERIIKLAEENKALKAKVRELETEVRRLRKRLGEEAACPAS